MTAQRDISIVFLGSGPVAAKSLALLAQTFSIEAVITKPRPVHHRGSFPVIDMAEDADFENIPFITASNRTELSQRISDRQTSAKPFASQIGVVIDFGIIIAQDVIDSFPLGIINSHFSLLPQWRGADPITFSILSGQAQTGVSIMLITAGLDEGPLLGYADFQLTPAITTPELTTALIELSDYSLRTTLPLYIHGDITAVAQNDLPSAQGVEPTYSRKLTKQDGILDFTKSATQLEREIRAFIGWPASRTKLGDKEVVVTQAEVLHISSNEHKVAGSIWRDGKRFGIYTSEDILEVIRLKPAGKAEMSASDFVNGYTF